MRNPQHIWTSTTLKLDDDFVEIMLGCNGIAKIQIGGVDGFYIYMPGDFGGDPRGVIVAYKKQVQEIEAGFAGNEKSKRLASLNSFQKELDSQHEEGLEPISDDDMRDLGGLDDSCTMVEDLGEVESKVVYLDRGRRDD